MAYAALPAVSTLQQIGRPEGFLQARELQLLVGGELPMPAGLSLALGAFRTCERRYAGAIPALLQAGAGPVMRDALSPFLVGGPPFLSFRVGERACFAPAQPGLRTCSGAAVLYMPPAYAVC